MEMVVDQEGAHMIQDLQKLAGIVETDESAMALWKEFSIDEKESTIRAHKDICEDSPEMTQYKVKFDGKPDIMISAPTDMAAACMAASHTAISPNIRVISIYTHPDNRKVYSKEEPKKKDAPE